MDGHHPISGNRTRLIDLLAPLFTALFFNPGKATNSFGILTIEEGIEGKIESSR